MTTVAIAPAAPRPNLVQRFLERLTEWVFLPLLVFPSVVLVLTTYGALVLALDPKEAFQSALFALAICTVCLLPAFLVLALANTMRQARSRRTTLTLDTKRGLDDAANREDAEFLAPLQQTAEQIWSGAMNSVPQALQRFVRYAGIYAFFASSLMLASAAVSAPSLISGQVEPARAYRIYFAYAIATTTAVVFLGDFARMLMRATAHDGTARMFAAATRRLLITIVGTSALACTLLASSQGSELLEKGFGWFVVGLAMAILGERAWTSMTNQLGKLVGVAAVTPAVPTDLLVLDGLGQSDVERLAEEGIDSVHALSLTTAAHLYVSTPYPLFRLIDWQDQGHLYLRVGPRRFATIREQLGIRGAVELQRLCRALLRSSGGVKREDFQRALGLTSETETQLTIERFANDRTIAQLRLLVTSSPGR
jgi:hypothetical protein